MFCFHKASEAFLQRLVALYVASHYKVGVILGIFLHIFCGYMEKFLSCLTVRFHWLYPGLENTIVCSSMTGENFKLTSGKFNRIVSIQFSFFVVNI